VPDPTPFRLRISGTVRETADTSLVLGHSRHASADLALHFAVDLAQRLHADLHVVHAVDLFDYPVDPDAADWEQQAHRALAEQRRRVEAALADSSLSWTYQPVTATRPGSSPTSRRRPRR
jgi:nucleotide-binding universal stress UspA family protein